VIKVVIKKLGVVQMLAVELTGLKPGNDPACPEPRR
jgi:hypothetical protein